MNKEERGERYKGRTGTGDQYSAVLSAHSAAHTCAKTKAAPGAQLKATRTKVSSNSVWKQPAHSLKLQVHTQTHRLNWWKETFELEMVSIKKNKKKNKP